MRLLPDKNFKENYKKRYTANYEKLVQKQVIKSEHYPDKMKQRLLGFAVFVVIVFIFIMIGVGVSGIFDEKEAKIASLTSKMLELNDTIREYQIVDGDAKYAQLDEAVNCIADLQNQYVLNDFSETFDVYAARYLGSFNYNWADACDFERPVWKGYCDKSCDYKDFAEMLFILYDRTVPVMVVNVRFTMDRFGNLEEMTSINKAVLV